jgi:tRNA(Arg) A34 adenosine deaminase TadA
MCAGAMIQSRIRSLYYGTKDSKAGGVESVTRLLDIPFNHTIDVHSGILEEESKMIVKNFFKKLREK